MPAGLVLCRIIPVPVPDFRFFAEDSEKMPKGVRYFLFCPSYRVICFDQEPRGSHMPFVGMGWLPGNRRSIRLKGEIV